MRFHVPDQGNGSMIIVEKDESPILFFDLGQSNYGPTTFKSYYNQYLGYISKNDHISINESSRPLNIVISHLHSDHFKNLTSGFLDGLLQETNVFLQGIWSPPVDLLFATSTNDEITDNNYRVKNLHDINSDIDKLFTQLHDFSSSKGDYKNTAVKNHFIDSHRDNLSLGEEFEVEWLSPPATSADSIQRGIEDSNLEDVNLYSPVSNVHGFINNVNKENKLNSQTRSLPFLYSPTSLLLRPDEQLSNLGIRFLAGTEESKLQENAFEDLDLNTRRFLSEGENHDIMNRISTVLKITDKESTTSALLTGDATSETLSYLLSNHLEKLSSVDLLQTPHHGSNNGLISPIFFSTIQADHAFLQHGSIEQYGHPHPETLADLILAGTANIHQSTTASDFMYEDEDETVYSNNNEVGEENRSIIDKNTIIAAEDLTGNVKPDEIIQKYHLEETDGLGINRTLEDVFSNSKKDVLFGRFTKNITIREVLAQLNLTTDIGLRESSEVLHNIEENPTLIEVLEIFGPIVILPIELTTNDLANAIDQIDESSRIVEIYRRDNVIIDRTEEREKILITDDDIARYLILFGGVHTDDIDFSEIDLSDSPLIEEGYTTLPTDANLEQIKEHGEVTEEEINELRGKKVENRLIIHDIYSSKKSPPPTETESDFSAGHLLGFQPKRPDLRTAFKRSEKHTRHYPVEMTPGFLPLEDTYLEWILKNHPSYRSVSSRRFIAKRGVKLVEEGVFSPSDILKNIISRNFRKLNIISEEEYSTLPHLQSQDRAALIEFDELLPEDKKNGEYSNIFAELFGDGDIPVEF